MAEIILLFIIIIELIGTSLWVHRIEVNNMRLKKELLRLQQENYNYQTRLNKLVGFKHNNGE
jgi:hypothetical protein